MVLSSECESQAACLVAISSHMNLDSTVGMIGNVSSGIDILIIQAENDSLVPNEQGLLLQQRLTEVNHPNHLLITYPNLGHLFTPSNQWVTAEGPVEGTSCRICLDGLHLRQEVQEYLVDSQT